MDSRSGESKGFAHIDCFSAEQVAVDNIITILILYNSYINTTDINTAPVT